MARCACSRCRDTAPRDRVDPIILAAPWSWTDIRETAPQFCGPKFIDTRAHSCSGRWCSVRAFDASTARRPPPREDPAQTGHALAGGLRTIALPAPALSSTGDDSRPHYAILDRKIAARFMLPFRRSQSRRWGGAPRLLCRRIDDVAAPWWFHRFDGAAPISSRPPSESPSRPGLSGLCGPPTLPMLWKRASAPSVAAAQQSGSKRVRGALVRSGAHRPANSATDACGVVYAPVG